jgi:hypothetical protein
VRHLVAGLDYIALGMLSFALAWLTSLVKGGKLMSLAARYRKCVDLPSWEDVPDSDDLT